MADVGALVLDPLLQEPLGLGRLKLVDFLQKAAEAGAQLAGRLGKQRLKVLDLGVDVHEARVLHRELLDEAKADSGQRRLKVRFGPQINLVDERNGDEELILVRILTGLSLPLAVELLYGHAKTHRPLRMRLRYGAALRERQRLAPLVGRQPE